MELNNINPLIPRLGDVYGICWFYIKWEILVYIDKYFIFISFSETHSRSTVKSSSNESHGWDHHTPAVPLDVFSWNLSRASPWVHRFFAFWLNPPNRSYVWNLLSTLEQWCFVYSWNGSNLSPIYHPIGHKKKKRWQDVQIYMLNVPPSSFFIESQVAGLGFQPIPHDDALSPSVYTPN